MKTVLPSKKTPSRKRKIGQFAKLSKAKCEKIGADLKQAREERLGSIKSLALINGLSEAQIVRNEKGAFGIVQDAVIIAHLASVGLTSRGVLA